MANDQTNAPGIPRPRYPSAFNSRLAIGTLMAQGGFEYRQAFAIGEMLRQSMEKQAVDEETNYRWIEDRLGGGGGRPATYTIAASDSLQANRESADFLCDGTDDDVVLSTALSAAGAVNGSVLAYEGVYNCTGPVGGFGSGSLFGVGRDRVFLRFHDGVSGGYNGNARHLSVWDDGTGLAITGISGQAIDCSAYDFATGVGMNGTIMDCYVEGCHVGLKIDNGGQGIGNFVYGSTGFGIQVHGFGIAVGNYIEDTLSTGGNLGTINPGVGIIMLNSAYSLVLGNRILTCNRSGIFAGSDDCGIYGNIILNAGQLTHDTFACIEVANSSDRNNVQFNIGRTFSATVPKYGANVSGAGCNDNVVTNNDFKNAYATGPGIQDTGTGTVTAAGNRV